jgi:hypothetical protein
LEQSSIPVEKKSGSKLALKLNGNEMWEWRSDRQKPRGRSEVEGQPLDVLSVGLSVKAFKLKRNYRFN